MHVRSSSSIFCRSLIYRSRELSSDMLVILGLGISGHCKVDMECVSSILILIFSMTGSHPIATEVYQSIAYARPRADDLALGRTTHPNSG